MNRLSLIVVVWLAAVLPARVYAFEVTPLYLEMTAGGKGASASLTVENSSPQRLALETEVVERKVTADSKETRHPDEDSFLIFPPQAMVEPGKTQVFRLQWLGGPDIPASRSFYVMLKQLPVNFTADTASGIKFLTNIGASVHVLPMQPQLSGVAEEIAPTVAKGKPQLTFFVRNTGSRLFYTDGVRYRITGQGLDSPLEIDGETVRQTEQTELITPGGRRKLMLPLPKAVTAATVAIVFP